MCLSSWATSSIEDVVAQGVNSGIPYAMQLSVVEDPDANLFTIRKAEGESGYGTLHSLLRSSPLELLFAHV